MSKIHILPQKIINQIAAGEVVERPASVLKELLENSIDAGATKISVYVEEGGIKLLKVIDNGSGIERGDVKLAFASHATGKIETENDLDQIITLGFRGEALASIGSVAKVQVITKTQQDPTATQYVLHGGDEIDFSEIGARDGTNITISELFYNTPARKKFLKSTSTELRHILNIFTSIALANPKIHFELYNNDKLQHNLPKTDSLKTRVHDLFTPELAEKSFIVNYDGIIKITGLVAKPELALSRKGVQIIIVNGRPVMSATIAAAVRQAFETTIPKNLYPQFVLLITLDPGSVDVNVHPRKMEVRFSNEQQVFKAVMEAVRSALTGTLQKEAEIRLDRPELKDLKPLRFETKTKQNSYYVPNQSKLGVKGSIEFTKNLLENTPRERLPWEEDNSTVSNDPAQEFVTVAHQAYQLLDSYIITTNGAAIQIIDQHAAAERINYEKIKRQFEEGRIQTQGLLIPFELKLSQSEKILLRENLEKFVEYGFKVEEFGVDAYVVQEAPVDLVNKDLSKTIKEILAHFADNDLQASNKYDDQKDKLIATLACHASIRANDKMDRAEIDQMMKDLKACEVPYSCPHGRPIIFEIPLLELEKKFKRK